MKKPKPSTAVVKKQSTELNGGNGSGRRLGRPRKLTAELKENITNAVRAGNYAKVACQASNIDESTFYRWVRIGEDQAQLDEADRDSALDDFYQFYLSISEAEANSEVTIVSGIHDKIPDDPRLGLDFLARKHPERWGKKPDVSVELSPTLVISDVMQLRGTDDEDV